MAKKTLSRRPELQDLLPSSGLNFIYHSYFFLCQCVDILSKLDDKKVLHDSKEMQIPNLHNIKNQNMRIKKLLHIDLKQNHIYWQVLKKSKRLILKQSLQNRQKLYEWKFDQTALGPIQAIQVLGKWKYLELKNSSTQNQDGFKIINFNALNNSFINFQEFYLTIINLINVKLMEAYDGRILKNFVSNIQKEQVLEQLWEFVSIEITRIWKKFQEQIQSKKLKQHYEQILYKDITKLFNTNSDYKCKGGQTTVPKRQKLTRQISFIQDGYKSQYQQCLVNSKKDISFYPLETHLLFDPQTTNTTQDFIDQSFYKYPHPQNYPFIENYVSQKYQDRLTQQICRKSLKRPANKCHQKCQCLQPDEDKYKCPNIERKIQCQHHDCLNSKIRQKKGLHCWYLDKDKNDFQIQNLKQKLTLGLQIREYHSFGLDFYTVTLLYYLLPFNRIQDGEIIENEKQKKTIIQIIIPYEVSKTQNLYLAVKQITYGRQYQKYSYETRILEKKLRWIKKMELQNFKQKMQNRNFIYPQVQQPKCFYKGLGVINSGFKLPKNTLIGEFIGQTMPRYRIQQKQQLCAQLIKMKNQIKFYCIDVLTHLDQKNYPRFFAVDPQNKGNFCRNLNHSCDPNCKVDVIVSQGKYILGVYTTREIQQNEELTFDYMSVTDDYEEYKKSVCLCSSLACRGRYFRYQDQIYTDLDEVFLEKEQPIRKRIKKLIQCSQNVERKRISFSSRMDFLQKKQIDVSFIPEQSRFWFVHWIEVNQKIIARQLQYLYRKLQNESASKLRYSICQKSKIYSPKLSQKQKIATLNAKIQKISHYLNRIKDFSPPFSYKSHQLLIKKLQYIFNQSEFKQRVNLDKQTKQDLSSFEVKIWDIRFSLIEIGSYELTINKDIGKAFFYFQQAFTFIYIQTHKYPNYQSQPIKIWRQNLSKYQDTVQYFGKDLYILQNLILWSGQFKNIQKKNSNNFNNKDKKSIQSLLLNQNLSQLDDTFSLQIDNDFKRQFLKNQIQLAVFQMQQQKFRLRLPEQIKRKSLLSFSTDVKRLKRILEKWIEKEFLLLQNTDQNFKGAYKIRKNPKTQQQVKIEPSDSIIRSGSLKKVRQKSERKNNLKSKKISHKVKLQA